MTVRTHKLKKIIDIVVRYLVPVFLTVLLVGYMFHKVNFGEMMAIISQGVDYWWILAAMILSVFSHIVRALRWRLQLRSLGATVPFMALCCSIFGCYAMNLVLPRLGEFWRCTYISRRGRISFSTVLGSMVADRLMDSLTVLFLLLLTLVVANSAIISFMDRYPIGRDMLSLLYSPFFWGALILTVIAVIMILRHYGSTGPVRRLKGFGSDLWKGFWAVSKMKGRGLFLFYSLCIWGCYFIQLYVAFFAFDFTARLCAESSLGYGLVPCLVAFVLSSIGMAIPSNGGLGPWNLAIMFGLSLYGVTEAQGTAFSMLQWSGQTVMLILLGVFTMIYIFIDDKKRNRALSVS
ncbi:MAG: flippase-like domain-containing protein [Bacteroidales bacterium]|nr:flippase-like domain-containing protein [Bacteroidales bacterium]MBD5190871.1 flippase-like domain-containing protein [Bacteroidales bacterium]